MKSSQINSAPIGPKDVSGLGYKRLLSRLPLPLRLTLIWKGLVLLCRLRLGHARYAASDRHIKSGDLIVSGFFNEGLGVGRAADLTLKTLENSGLTLKAQPLRHLFTHVLNGNVSLGQEGGVWIIHANAPESMIALLAYEPKTWCNRYRIAYWAWETPEIPKDWVYASRYFHEIWAPSQFVLEAISSALARAGQAAQVAKLRLMPHPIAINALAAPNKAAFGLSDQKCEVLCLFDCDSSALRKNPWATIETWLKAFESPESSAHLVIKISGKTNRQQVLARLNSLCAKRDDITIVEERFDDNLMDQFIASFDVLLSLHRSEGFGLSLAEAMRAGVVVMATEGSGNGDFMTPENSILIPARYVPIHDPTGPYALVSGEDNQVWAEPDIEVAATALKEVVSNQALRQRLRQQAQKDMAPLPPAWTASAIKAMKFNNYL